MLDKKILGILLVLVIVVIYSANIFYRQSNVLKAEPKQESVEVHKVKFYDEKAFSEGVEKAKDLQKSSVLIRGGIVPHHLFAGNIIADFFKRLSFQNPQTIILIGPNHYEKGSFKALSSLDNWETPFGIVETDRQLTKQLLDKNLIEIDENVLSEDHATSGMLPFIKYLMPETKVVQILLKGSFSEKESEILAANLKELMNENIIVVAPVDFSHYLTSPEAKVKDKETLKVMKDFNYRTLYFLNNDYLDSPSSIGVLLMVMQKTNSTNMDLLFNTNSGEMQKNNSIETTSYFSIIYH